MDEPSDTIDYGKLIQDALRGVVYRVLAQVAEYGLPGEHHFYIGFRTGHPGVQVPPFLRDQYPDEIRIVLEQQFWDLYVDEEGFSVSLNFNASRQRLTVPFTAITEFVDLAANLALRFDPKPSSEDEEEEELEPDVEETPPSDSGKGGSVVRFDPSRRK